MSPGRVIKPHDFLEDVRLGLTDEELMEKYRVSAEGLRSAFRKLIAMGSIDKEELEFRSVAYIEAVDLEPDHQF